MRATLFCIASLFLLLLGAGRALTAEDQAKSPTEPQLISVFPLGGTPGTHFAVQVRGIGLEEVGGVWFECSDLSAEVESIEASDEAAEEGEPQEYVEEKKSKQLIRLRVQAQPSAQTGLHVFRLVTPRGVSNALALQLLPHSVIEESVDPHQQASRAQPLTPPVVVNGRTGEKGSIDYYSFQAAAGQEWLFLLHADVYPISYLPPAEIHLHEVADSWFDSRQSRQLPVQSPALSWEPLHGFRSKSSASQFRLLPNLKHRFEREGRYFVSVSGFLGGGGNHHFYQLAVIPAGDPGSRPLQKRFGQLAHHDPADWRERDASSWKQGGSFDRPLGPDRLQLLASRGLGSGETVQGGAQLKPVSSEPEALPAQISETTEQEPNDGLEEALELGVPSLVEGVIQSAADVDTFRFRVSAGQELAFEIETPEKRPPRFNPWLKIFDSQGQPLMSNIFKEYGGDGDDVNKNIERKTIYSFPEAGEYTLQIRELTFRQGGPEYRYRLMIRPQVPHIGRTEVSLGVRSQLSSLITLTDRMNLLPGQAQEFTLICEKEEGFQGQISVTVEDLPAGVRAFPSTPAAWTDILMRGIQYRPTDDLIMDASHHRSKREILTLALVADPDAPAPQQPRLVRVVAWAIQGGKVGPPVAAGRFPVMVLDPQRQAGSPGSEEITLNLEQDDP